MVFTAAFIFAIGVVSMAIYLGTSGVENLVIHCDNGKKIIKNEYDAYTDAEPPRAYARGFLGFKQLRCLPLVLMSLIFNILF